MVKEIISHWLEEGFSNHDKFKKDDKNHQSTIFWNESGVNITPKPLFSVFLGEIELDSSFLIEYLEIIENGLRRGKNGSKETHLTTENIVTLPLATKIILPEIEYERKNIFLSSKIFSLFEMPATYISNWSPDYQSIVSQNNNYKRALEYHKKFPSNFEEKSTLIGNFNVSEKHVETSPIILEDKSFLVNAYLMGKHYDRKEIPVKPTPKTFQQYIFSRTTFRDSKEFQQKLPENPLIFKKIEKNLNVIERALNYNTNETTILSFNSLLMMNKFIINPSHSSLETKQTKHSSISQSNACQCLQFSLPNLGNKYYVSCIESNPLNPSIFICGYSISPGEEMDHEPRGILSCWNINQCGYPERIYYFEEAVSCINVSKNKPYHVAVGMHYGLIAIVDLRQPDSLSYVTNRSSKERPVDTIKSVRWMVRKYSLYKVAEVLLAVSVDGVITSWKDIKLLKGSILATVKKKNSEQEKQKQFYINNTILCLCMQPNPDDDNFAVGTIEGHVFIMNMNSPEDNVTIKHCHFGSVNCIKWSPFAKNVFFTCGSDRCLHIWEINKTKPSKTLILPDNILDISLSSKSLTLFSAITKHKLYVYDLAANLHKPIVEEGNEGQIFSSLNLCPNNDWFFVGQSDGRVILFEIINSLSKLEFVESDIFKNMFLPGH